MRLIVARCQVSYFGRTNTTLAEAIRFLMCKADGTVMVWADGGRPNIRPLNWMTPPTVIEEQHDSEGALTSLTARKFGADERLEISITKVLCDVEHDVDAIVALVKGNLERELQDLLAEQPDACEPGLRLIQREWPTDIGPVDLLCRDSQGQWVAVEVKRLAGLESVQQLTRYLERIRQDPGKANCRGLLVAKAIRPQARVLAATKGIKCIQIDADVLRGERQPELTLFENH